MSEITLKKNGTGISVPDIRTFESKDGKNTYVVLKQGKSYHTFVEVEAKDAAIECGSKLERNAITRQHWNVLWDE